MLNLSKHGRASLEENPRNRRPKSATIPEINKVHDIWEDRRLEMSEIDQIENLRLKGISHS